MIGSIDGIKNGDIIIFRGDRDLSFINAFENYENMKPDTDKIVQIYQGSILTIVDKDIGFPNIRDTHSNFGNMGMLILFQGQILEIVKNAMYDNFEILGSK